jgi:dipeptidyl aminopeptidase/acylaminoacyl peptidase
MRRERAVLRLSVRVMGCLGWATTLVVAAPAPATAASPPAAAAAAAPATAARPTQPPAPARRTVGQLVLDGVPEAADGLRQRVLQYTGARSARLADWSPDGRGLLILTRFGETAQLHSVATPLGARSQWTFLDEPVSAAVVRPQPSAASSPPEIVLSVDKGGSEFYQLWWLRRVSGESVRLTDGKSRHESPRWSADGRRLAFAGTARNGKDFDIYVWDAPVVGSADAPAPPRRIADLQGNWRIADWSPDARNLILVKFISIEQSELYILDTASGQVTPLLADWHGKTVAIGGAQYGPSGEIWLTSDWQADVLRLGRLGKDGEVTWVTANIPWKVEDFQISAQGRVAFLVNEDGWSRLYTLGSTGAPQLTQGVPAGVASGLRWRADGDALALTVASATSPGDVWTVTWPQSPVARKGAPVRSAAGGAAPVVQRWTESEVGGLDAASFVSPQLVRYPTFDRVDGRVRQIPCFVYKPRGKGPFPFVVHIHGGPEGQARPGFDPSIQYWLRELGVAVLVPNVRGSDGYGKAYLALDNGKLREDSVADIGALLDWARTQPDLDPQRAAVYGGSYGGYMVLASLVKYGDRLRAGIDIVGISNFVTFLENTQAYRRDNRRAEYGDERDPAMRDLLQRISPLTHANRIRSQLMVVQGANDPRVPVGEAEQIVAAVRAAGKSVWYLLARDEGHGFQKKSNRDEMVQSVVQFWQQHLLR